MEEIEKDRFNYTTYEKEAIEKLKNGTGRQALRPCPDAQAVSAATMHGYPPTIHHKVAMNRVSTGSMLSVLATHP
ncbi:MAG: hypothetical protein GC178_15915 [Flavobacteriales bacterium]|nr:hypothetical protein [Flavobacteriales bacterium]